MSSIHGPEPLMSSGLVVSTDPRHLGMHVQFLPGFLYQIVPVSKMKKQREGKRVNGAQMRAESSGAPFRVLSASALGQTEPEATPEMVCLRRSGVRDG